MKKKVIVLSGGFSDEKEVSQKTSSAIASALIENNYSVEIADPADFDDYSSLIGYLKKQKPFIVFIGLHGAEGEDGRLQAMLSLEKIPFTGSRHTGSAIAMDKFVSSMLAHSYRIPVPKQVLLTEIRHLTEEEITFLELPLIVKPNSSGSSVGVYVVEDINDLENAINQAFKYDHQVLCQEFIEGLELTVSILDNEILPIVEIRPIDGFYDYTNKYTKGKTEYICPAPLNDEQTQKIQDMAKRVFFGCQCSVYGRVDFRYDGKYFYFLEINTLPGMTGLSLTPMAAKQAGYSFNELIKKIINVSLKS